VGTIRYLLFGVIGVVVAACLFFALSWLIGPHFEAGTDFIEGWIIRATCDNYALNGTVRNGEGAPVPLAVVEAIYDGQRSTTASGSDGQYRLYGRAPTCAPLPETASVTASAAGYRPVRRVLRFHETALDIVLEPSLTQ
jgi:hypothetical protein